MSTLPVGTVLFDHVSKRYRLGALGTLRSTLEALTSRRREDAAHDLWALRDVSFRVEPGGSLGLIGPNGAGKTTTLKLLSNITRPTAGRIDISGRVSSLIELGAGFHPELTGRENIFLNGAILGLSRREIQRKLDEIIAFSELERFIDTPVKRYSSGMYVRLGFAVAANVEPDVLLVDEVLAVGDASFRQRCMERMQQVLRSGTSIILVSHNMTQVEKLCRQALLLVAGQARGYGATNEVLAAYDRMLHGPTTEYGRFTEQQNGMDDLYIRRVTIAGTSTGACHVWRHDAPLRVEVVYRATKRLENPIVKVRFVRHDGTVVGMSASNFEPGNRWVLDGEGIISVCFAPNQLVTGTYCVTVRVIDGEDTVALASGQSEWFQVQGPHVVHETDRGFFVPKVQWLHEETAEERP